MLPLVLLTAVLALLPPLAQADTVEFIRGGTVNAVVTMQSDKVTIRAQFAEGGSRETIVERRFVSSIEFNDKTTNSGPAPANWGVFQPNDAERFEFGTVDVVLLSDGSRLRGRVKTCTATAVVFDGEEIPRSDVKILLLGSAVLGR
jgi:hypothetical protein